jgi:hypothetical protein
MAVAHLLHVIEILIIGTFHLRPVALGQGPWWVWVDFVRGLLRADTTHMGRLKPNSVHTLQIRAQHSQL